MAQPVERPPFLALFGLNREVFSNEVVRGMAALYRGLFVHKDGNGAMHMLNAADDPDKLTFGVFTCEKLFCNVWEATLKKPHGRPSPRGVSSA